MSRAGDEQFALVDSLGLPAYDGWSRSRLITDVAPGLAADRTAV
jgi:hypothetical protein